MILKKIKTYFAFTKGAIMNVFAYKASAIGWFLGDILTLIILFSLWTAVYANSSEPIINGFSFKEMIFYLVMARIASTFIFSSYSFWIIGEDIYEGNIAMNLIKPINYRVRAYAMSFGSAIGNFLLMFLPLGIIAHTIMYFVLGITFLNPLNLLFFFFSALLAHAIYECFDFLIGQIALYTNAMFGVYLTKLAVFGFLTGAMLPISFFPTWLQQIVRILPFASLIETPILISMNRLSTMEILRSLGIQILWVIGLMIISNYSFKRLAKRVISVGG